MLSLQSFNLLKTFKRLFSYSLQIYLIISYKSYLCCNFTLVFPVHSELSPEKHRDVSLQSLLCHYSSGPVLSDEKGSSSELCSGEHSLLVSLHTSSGYREER